jgi:hypothetical protein
MAAAAEAERRRRKVKLLLTNILGTNGQPSVTHVPFFFVRITPCTTFPIEKVLFNLPLLGPIFHFGLPTAIYMVIALGLLAPAVEAQ